VGLYERENDDAGHCRSDGGAHIGDRSEVRGRAWLELKSETWHLSFYIYEHLRVIPKALYDRIAHTYPVLALHRLSVKDVAGIMIFSEH